MNLFPPQHKWGETERSDRGLEGKSVWHWCRCTDCGAPGFRINDSKVVRCWQPCDTVVIA